MGGSSGRYRRALVGALAVGAATTAAGCGGGESPAPPTVAAARTFRLSDFRPSGPVPAGHATPVSFAIEQPSGDVLTRFRRGDGPHTGVHVIAVRDDVSTLIHRHPPVAADGRVSDRLTFSRPGGYRVVVDAYPDVPGMQRNFQLTHDVTVSGAVTARPVPPFRPVQRIGGYRFALSGSPRIRVAEGASLVVRVTDAAGRPAAFEPYYGAIAHAIYFRAGSLDYFHTHVCGPAVPACSGAAGAAAGTSERPGELRVGVLLPTAGTWRLFLQVSVRGRVLTAPYTLTVT